MSSPDNLGPLFECINIAFFIVAGTSFALRVYVRAILINAFGKDDYWMTAAMVRSLTSRKDWVVIDR